MAFLSPAKHQKPIYRARAAFRNMVRRCLNRCGTEPAYRAVELRMTLDEWLTWAVPRYEAFSRERPDESPNVSRKNDTGHYEIGNVEIITLAENRSRQVAPLLARPDGTKLCSLCREVRTTAMFTKNRSRPDGLDHRCLECKHKRPTRDVTGL